MSEIGEAFQELKRARQVLRQRFGVKCPRYRLHRPKAPATILLPQQTCKVDGYRDPRPRLSRDVRNQAYKDAGLDIKEVD